MAIVIKGKSKCQLCNRIISDKDEIVLFPAFLPQKHMLWKYSDSGFHQSCFDKWEHSQEFLSIWNKCESLFKERPIPPKDAKSIVEWYKISPEIIAWEKRYEELFHKFVLEE